MPGGLLNLVAYGNQNVYLNGNPSKTFFKTIYKKYTNFGLQKFRIDFDGQRHLRTTESSKFTFRMKRYAELLMDTYLVVQLPTIWSPIYPPQDCSSNWAPYEFKWIDDLGTQMIEEVEISVGGQTLNKYSGAYLLAMVQRDFSAEKKALYDNMTGNISELNDPGNVAPRVNAYPNAYYTDSTKGPEPSIRARKLYIPINFWFTMAAKMAFPLVALQYNELEINITLRPIQELIVIRDVEDPTSEFKHIQPNFNDPLQQFYRFLQPPPDIALSTTSYQDKRTNWNADIHLVSTYGFLTEEESKVFAAQEQKYLFKSIYDWKFFNVTGSQRVKLENTMGMISSWMWTFQRSDINLRNEWGNYTNWPYKELPNNSTYADPSGNWTILDCSGGTDIGPGYNPVEDPLFGHSSGLVTTGVFSPENQKNILLQLGILLDGKYRENVLDEGIYNYVEKYVRTSGNAPDGLYNYSFAIHNDPFDFQPSGAMNMSKFKDIQLEFTTYSPPLDPSAQFMTICDSCGNLIGVNKPTWRIYDYNYNMTVHEERYNVLTFVGGNCGLMYAR
tara:strand:+ start:10134 stop:11807 length:1674 start_codon:yes stop_codon:yes gene_type:complete